MMIVAIIGWLVTTALLLVRQCGLDWRGAWVGTFLAFFTIVAASTEFLSLYTALSYRSLSLLWICLSSISAGLLFLPSRYRESSPAPRPIDPPSREVVFFAAAIAIIAGVNLVVSLLAPPNTWDSMTYHMARVAHWIQNQSVDFYPTPISRQNHSMPLAEFAVLHLQILSRSDYLANLVQWFSYLTCIVAATLVAKDLAPAPRAQWFAGLFAATLPMAILQSSSTQNDMLTSAFCLLFFYFLHRLIRSGGSYGILLGGLSLGLALLTKGTAYIFCAVVGTTCAAWAWSEVKTRRARLLLCGRLLAIVILALLVNSGHYVRNYQLYGHPLSTETRLVRNEVLTPGIVAANLVRNIATQLATPIAAVNEILTNTVRERLAGEADNPASTFGKTKFSIVFYLNEDFAGNLPHFLLTAFALLLIPGLRLENKRSLYLLAAIGLLSIVLFSTLLKWQPWGSRLLTPYYILAAPLVGIVIAQKAPVGSRILQSIALLLVVYSLPFALMNNSRPLLPRHGISLFATPRAELYFANRRELYDSYRMATSLAGLKNVPDIGLLLSNDQYEYPIWVLTERHATIGTPLLKHVAVRDISRRLEADGGPLPLLMLASGRVDRMDIDGSAYKAVFTGDHLSLLESYSSSLSSP